MLAPKWGSNLDGGNIPPDPPNRPLLSDKILLFTQDDKRAHEDEEAELQLRGK